MLSDINKKVTSWDRNAHLDPSLTQRVTAMHQTIQAPSFDQQAGMTATTGIFGVKTKSAIESVATIHEEGP